MLSIAFPLQNALQIADEKDISLFTNGMIHFNFD